MQRKKPRITLIPNLNLLKISKWSFALSSLALCFTFNLLINNSTFAAQPTISLSVATPELSTMVAPGEIGYLSSNVTYSVNNAESYTLKVSYANGSSSLANGNQTIPGVGTNGVTGTAMKSTDANAWGYSWTSSSNTNLDNLAYYTMPAYNNNLTGTDFASGYLDGGTGDKASTTQKIVFAAKFANDNEYAGHYTSKLLLSLVATPKALGRQWSNGTYSEITTMQEMSTDICNQVSTPTSANNVPTLILDDTRGGGYTNTDSNGAYSNSYIIAKLGDGNCWMLQNMKLDLNVANSLTPNNSNVSSSWPATSALATSWIKDSAKPYYWKGSTALNDKYQEKYGNYYNWCAATAGTCVDSGEAKSSICPRGWRLPTGNKTSGQSGYDYSFNKLDAVQSGSWTSANDNGLSKAPGRYLGYGFFPAAGRIENDSFSNIDSVGSYWSSTANDAMYAHCISMNSTLVYKSDRYYRWAGTPLRCVAPAS